MPLLMWVELGAIVVAATLAYVFRKRFVAWPTGIRLASIFLFVALFGHVAYQAAERDEKVEPVFDVRGTGLHWPRTPVKVFWRDSDFKGGVGRAANDAVEFWNGHLNCQLFERTANEDDAQVYIHPADFEPCGSPTAQWPLSKHDSAGTIYCRVGPWAGKMDIQTVSLASMEEFGKGLIHELGHTVWLAHDPEGIMAADTTHLQLPWLPNPKDVRALREKYCTSPPD